MGRMNWRKAALQGKSTQHHAEHEFGSLQRQADRILNGAPPKKMKADRSHLRAKPSTPREVKIKKFMRTICWTEPFTIEQRAAWLRNAVALFDDIDGNLGEIDIMITSRKPAETVLLTEKTTWADLPDYTKPPWED